MSKAATVREMILAAKIAGSEAKDLVGPVVDALGLSKALARTYINNNWEKVEIPLVAEVEATAEVTEAA